MLYCWHGDQTCGCDKSFLKTGFCVQRQKCNAAPRAKSVIPFDTFTYGKSSGQLDFSAGMSSSTSDASCNTS